MEFVNPDSPKKCWKFVTGQEGEKVDDNLNRGSDKDGVASATQDKIKAKYNEECIAQDDVKADLSDKDEMPMKSKTLG